MEPILPASDEDFSIPRQGDTELEAQYSVRLTPFQKELRIRRDALVEVGLPVPTLNTLANQIMRGIPLCLEPEEKGKDLGTKERGREKGSKDPRLRTLA